MVLCFCTECADIVWRIDFYWGSTLIIRKEIDYSTYSLSELEEAWLSVDDYAYPERAIEIYTRLKSMEKEEEGDDAQSPNEFVNLLSRFFQPHTFADTTFSDELLEQSNAEMKEIRVKAMIESRGKVGS